MDIKREAYDKLLKWKDSNDRTTLEVNGARQVGKPYLINKFADGNFKKKDRAIGKTTTIGALFEWWCFKIARLTSMPSGSKIIVG